MQHVRWLGLAAKSGDILRDGSGVSPMFECLVSNLSAEDCTCDTEQGRPVFVSRVIHRV